MLTRVWNWLKGDFFAPTRPATVEIPNAPGTYTLTPDGELRRLDEAFDEPPAPAAGPDPRVAAGFNVLIDALKDYIRNTGREPREVHFSPDAELILAAFYAGCGTLRPGESVRDLSLFMFAGLDVHWDAKEFKFGPSPAVVPLPVRPIDNIGDPALADSVALVPADVPPGLSLSPAAAALIGRQCGHAFAGRPACRRGCHD